LKLVVDTFVAMKWIIDETGSDAAYELQGLHALCATKPAGLRFVSRELIRLREKR